MSKGALIIGSNMAGLQAARDLADAGIQVHLIEPAPFLGNKSATTLPLHLLNTQHLEICKHPNIRMWTNTHIEHVLGEAGCFSVTVRTKPRYVDLTRCTACGDCIDVCPISIPDSDHKAICLDGQPGCMAINKYGKPPCANACPGGIHVQGYVALIALGRFQEAIDLIRSAIPFPGICGRVCTHPCEINCRRAQVDQPVAVRRLKRFLADWEQAQTETKVDPVLRENLVSKGQKVAIVGAGPGGMAAADQLARQGYPVTVFEKLPVIGGMMSVGIPEYRLPQNVIAREYQRIQDLGVEIKLNTSIGPDGEHSIDGLFELGYVAVCLAVGAHKSFNLGIPGEDLKGVVHGIDLLKSINLSQQTDKESYSADLKQVLMHGKQTRAAILGGGNTAMDVARSLRRLGLEDVRILYRRTRAEMPAMPEEIEDALQEGVQIEFLVSPGRVAGDREKGVTGLECIRMELGAPDDSGRRRPVAIEGSEFVVDLDVIVLAIGQAPDLGFLGLNHGINITKSDRLAINENNFMTNREGVFAAGDAVTRDKMVVIEAIGMGKKAATAIDAYLQGQDPKIISVLEPKVPSAHREMSQAELAPKDPVSVATIPLKQRQSSFVEMELAYSAEQAITEAQRCLVCGPCSECMACVEVCQPGAIIHEQCERIRELDIGAIIYANDPTYIAGPSLSPAQGIYHAEPENPLSGSAAAGYAMLDLYTERLSPLDRTPEWTTSNPTRIGLVVCQCGGEISQVVDTQAICETFAGWPGVIHTQVVPFSCSPETSQLIDELVKTHQLNKVVLAGCTCCSDDQICFSCTYQRLRCKENLGVFTSLERMARFEFVNIREQCAWIHQDHPLVATSKAKALISAAIARASETGINFEKQEPHQRSVLIIGRGPASLVCQTILASQNIIVQHLKENPDQVQRRSGYFEIIQDQNLFLTAAVILIADDENSAPNLKDLPGVFHCDPGLEPQNAAAAAARATAWVSRKIQVNAKVNPIRCRACSTCIEICEFGASDLVGEYPHQSAWIDPLVCTGCGTCAAHCPSGAITAGLWSDEQLEAVLAAVLE